MLLYPSCICYLSSILLVIASCILSLTSASVAGRFALGVRSLVLKKLASTARVASLTMNVGCGGLRLDPTCSSSRIVLAGLFFDSAGVGLTFPAFS